MNDLVPILVIATLTIGVYRMIELFVRRNERMAIIDKLTSNLKPDDVNMDMNLSFFAPNRGTSWALRLALLLIGIGIGALIGFFIVMYYSQFDSYRAEGTIYLSCISIFGGVGLLIAYLIEQKQIRADRNR